MTMTNRWLVMLGVGVLGACTAAPEDAPGTEATSAAALALSTEDRCEPEHDEALFARDARPYGRSMTFWAEQWWRWIYSTPEPINPFLHPTLDSDQNQTGPVFFLAQGDRTNTIPRHRAIAVLPSTVANDYPCPDPTFKPAPGQSLYDFLLSGVEPIQDAVVTIDATLDGRVLDGLLGYRFTSEHLTYLIGDPSLETTFDSCITGRRQPDLVDAFMFIIKPLEPGHHVLTTRVVNAMGEVFAHTENLEVQ